MRRRGARIAGRKQRPWEVMGMPEECSLAFSNRQPQLLRFPLVHMVQDPAPRSSPGFQPLNQHLKTNEQTAPTKAFMGALSTGKLWAMGVGPAPAQDTLKTSP